MAAWNELLIEAKAVGSVQDIMRRRYLRRLARHTKRNTILYYSGWLQKPELLRESAIAPGLGITDADKNGFMSAIYRMDPSKGLDLLLHTPGGDMAATESLIDYLRAKLALFAWMSSAVILHFERSISPVRTLNLSNS